MLFLCALGGVLSGLLLGNMKDILGLLPGLIAIIPAIIGMRGNISSSMGARLGSAFHLGLVEENLTSDIVVENLKSSLSLSLYVALLLPIFYSITSLLFSYPLNAKIVLSLFFLSITTGLTSGLVLAILTFSIIALSIRWEVDPDNITGPLLTTVGDLLTLTILFTYALLLGKVIL